MSILGCYIIPGHYFEGSKDEPQRALLNSETGLFLYPDFFSETKKNQVIKLSLFRCLVTPNHKGKFLNSVIALIKDLGHNLDMYQYNRL